MTNVDVQITGVEDVIRALLRFGRGCNEMDAAFGAVGESVAVRARALAPRRTGALSSTIRVSRGGRFASISAGSGSVLHAGVHEYGWAARGISARPYLRPAVDANETYAVDALTKQINHEIQAARLD